MFSVLTDVTETTFKKINTVFIRKIYSNSSLCNTENNF